MDQLKLWEGEEEDVSIRHTSLSKERERQERAQSVFRDQIIVSLAGGWLNMGEKSGTLL